MPSRKQHESMMNLEKCLTLVQQSSAKGGISAKEVGEKLSVHRATAHGYLNTLEYMGKVESQHGRWFAKKGKQTVKPLEKEFVIKLPIPKNEVQRLAFIEAQAKKFERMNLSDLAEDLNIILNKYNESRTIRIKGKNVDDIELQKLANMIQEANERGSKTDVKNVFKGLKKRLNAQKSL
jgi:Mn-dependent DtxR family transcriptional regulator